MMMRKATILIFQLAVLSGCNKAFLYEAITTAEAVDFEMYNNIIIVEAYVNNKWSKFIVDTGASVSLLDFNQSKKYDFTYAIDTDRTLSGFGGRAKLMKTSEVSFAIRGALANQPIRFSASDLSGLNAILSQSQQRILGILGNDFLQTHGAVIDYRKKKLLIASIE